jgi:hypothetical protein
MFPRPDLEKKPRPLWFLDALLVVAWALVVIAAGVLAFH